VHPDQPNNVDVSRQAEGVRRDAYDKTHLLVVEEEKGARLQGFYIHPEVYGAPPESGSSGCAIRK
jgi:hypothetical protein